jgi:glycine hydroxymethyltransferase
VTNDERLAQQVATAVYPGLLANYDVSRLLPLIATAVERETLAGAYADRCIANAQALAAALNEKGLDVLGAARAFTASHHIALDARDHGGGTQAARTLAAGGILLSEIGIPRDPAGGLRIGTQAITRQGFVEADMPAIAEAFAAILDGEPADVPAIRRRHSGVRFTL